MKLSTILQHCYMPLKQISLETSEIEVYLLGQDYPKIPISMWTCAQFFKKYF